VEECGDMFRASITASETATVLWYWFEITLTEGTVVYYGTTPEDNSGIGRVFLNVPPAFQITVHEKDFHTPNWSKKATLYQIFTDRFKRSALNRIESGLEYHRSNGRDNMWLHEDWNDIPEYLPLPDKDYYEPTDFFGGDIPGITEELPRLAEFGITVIYLNPIFEAASNHRYNTADYLKVDPTLGTQDDFDELIKKADELGIHIILDGVFSHTGDDSVYFNRYERYDNAGAFQSMESPYYHWYKFSEFPLKYASWWGFETLPEVDEDNADWINFIMNGEQSVLRNWIRKGASGYRLDVADELPDYTIEAMRAVVKSESEDNLLLGEVWEDATTKESYGKLRKYALGRGLDSVMNYPFLKRTICYLLGHINSFAYRRFLVSQSQNYPKEMYYSLMNLLSSHDSARIRTVLATGMGGRNMTREEQAARVISEEENAKGAALQKIGVAIQFALPGMPSVYYGDEVGMQGFSDPFNRCTYRKNDLDMEEWYEFLSGIRRTNQVLSTGKSIFYSTNGNVLGILRFSIYGEDAFGAVMQDRAILFLFNPRQESHRIVIDLFAEKDCLAEADRVVFEERNWKLGKSMVSGDEFGFEAGLLEVELPPLGVEILDLIWSL
jgi:glycosidase